MKLTKYVFSLAFSLILLTILPCWSQKAPKREMRGVWIATVDNIDWPSSDSLPVETQKKEMIELLDLVKEYHMNTVIFQVRPCADAFYPSTLEPWSKWLTGKQGQAPSPFYDPLDFAITESRKRGLDVHIWLNPYRAVKDTLKNPAIPDHITNTHPEWFVSYGNSKYFDPGIPKIRDFVATVVADLVRRYNIDAVHMDDYFYPYRIPNKEFPDSGSFASYPRGFAADKKDDWRRENVDLVIKQIHDSIKSIKPWVEFGISPFGVWRNYSKDTTGSRTQAGQTNYDDLYADILKWQKEKWIDYVAPQLYWHIGFKVADYKELLHWWGTHSYGANVYIGQAPYRINKTAKEKKWRNSKEITRQIKLNRTNPQVSGNIFFSAKILRQNPINLKQRLLRKPFRQMALPPANPGITEANPEAPQKAQAVLGKERVTLSWKGSPEAKNYVIYKFRASQKTELTDPANIVLVTSETQASFSAKLFNTKKFHYMVTAQSITNKESEPAQFEVQTGNANENVNH